MKDKALQQEFMERHKLSDESVKKAGEDIARESVHKRPPERLNIPTRPAHMTSFYSFCGKNGKEDERDR